MLATVLLLVAAVGLSSATSGFGRCNNSCLHIQNIDFDEFARTNGGVWPFVRITLGPRTTKLSKLTWITKQSPTKGLYSFTTHFVNKDGQNGTLLNATIQSDGPGVAVIKGIDHSYTLKMYIANYKPLTYVQFYVCAEDGEEDIDYRYLLALTSLTETEVAAIADLEAHYRSVVNNDYGNQLNHQ